MQCSLNVIIFLQNPSRVNVMITCRTTCLILRVSSENMAANAPLFYYSVNLISVGLKCVLENLTVRKECDVKINN